MAVRWLAHFKTEKEKVRNQPCNLFKKKLTIKPEIFALKIIFQEQRKNKCINQFSSVQSLSHVQLFATPGLDWLEGTLKSLLQHHSSKASILWRLAFFMVQLTHPYMTIGKTKGLTRQTFVTVSIVSPSICHEVMELDAMILGFWMLSFKPAFSLYSFTWSRGSLVLLHFLS